MAQDNNFWRGVFKFYSKHQHKLDDLVAAGVEDGTPGKLAWFFMN